MIGLSFCMNNPLKKKRKILLYLNKKYQALSLLVHVSFLMFCFFFLSCLFLLQEAIAELHDDMQQVDDAHKDKE